MYRGMTLRNIYLDLIPQRIADGVWGPHKRMTHFSPTVAAEPVNETETLAVRIYCSASTLAITAPDPA
jgi:hypothetical protein